MPNRSYSIYAPLPSHFVEFDSHATSFCKRSSRTSRWPFKDYPVSIDASAAVRQIPRQYIKERRPTRST